MILTMFAMMLMTTAFAEGENTTAMTHLEVYKMNVNINRLSKALNLCEDQEEVVEHIHHTFATELMFAATYDKNDRKEMVDRAIRNNVMWMRYVLNKEQMDTYLKLLYATINNRGLNK